MHIGMNSLLPLQRLRSVSAPWFGHPALHFRIKCIGEYRECGFVAFDDSPGARKAVVNPSSPAPDLESLVTSMNAVSAVAMAIVRPLRRIDTSGFQ